MGQRSEGTKAVNKVQRLYGTRAGLYEKVFVNQLGWGKELEAFFRGSAYVQPGLKILDAGCGTGVVTRTLYKIVQEKGMEASQFHAFDLTQAMLDIFQHEIQQAGLEHVQLAQADVLGLDSLPPSWNEYDIIISSALLEHIPEHQIGQALGNLRELLREGGLLLLFLTRRTFISQVTGKLWWKTNLFEDEQVKAMLEGVGFRRIELRKLSSKWSRHMIVAETRK